MKAAVYSLQGAKVKEIDVPRVFETEPAFDLIKRAVLAIQSAKRQPKGTNPLAGRDTTAEYRGWRGLPHMERTINVGRARLPRFKNRRHLLQGRVANVPQARGGVRAHPPKPQTKIEEFINKKEKRKATQAAIACTAQLELVKKRGHRIGEITLPFVIEDSLEKLTKTKDVKDVLVKLNLFADVERAKKRKTIRSGKGKRRGRKYKRAKSLLFVTKEKSDLFKAARNLEGVDVVPVKELNAELLAPGAVPGRLTVWTEGAIKTL
jgi:large subunit ribosomal protein L4e